MVIADLKKKMVVIYNSLHKNDLVRDNENKWMEDKRDGSFFGSS